MAIYGPPAQPSSRRVRIPASQDIPWIRSPMDRDLRSPSRPLALLLCAATAVTMVACGSDNGIIPSGPPGTLVVTAATTGPDADANGYRVALDSGPAQTLGTNGNTTFENAPSGEHSLVV